MNNKTIQKLVAVTGASGFIGKYLCRTLEASGHSVRPVFRGEDNYPSAVHVGELGKHTEWRPALEGVDCVIHTAGMAHISRRASRQPVSDFLEVNFGGTCRLADHAAICGVRRLIFISSIGVLGDSTTGKSPFNEDSIPNPIGPYAVSKWKAECALLEVATRTKMEVVIVRPPLVYGRNAPGNFRRLVDLIRRGLPLPFGLIENQRSLIAIENLVDFLVCCMEHPAAAGRTFLVSDCHDLSTPELICRLADAMGKAPRLLPVPPELIRIGGRLIGRSNEIESLIGSLQVDMSGTSETLNWRPPRMIEETLRRAAGSDF